MATSKAELTAAEIVATYKDPECDAESRQWLRACFPRLKLEFDAVDAIEDRQRRVEAKKQ